MRGYYVSVRDLSPLKISSVGVMALVAVFGVVLVTQAAGTGSAAEPPTITTTVTVGTIPGNTEETIFVTATADQDITSWEYKVIHNSGQAISPCGEFVFSEDFASEGDYESGSWPNGIANGLVGNVDDNAAKAVLLLDINHKDRLACIKATNASGSAYAGTLLLEGSTQLPNPEPEDETEDEDEDETEDETDEDEDEPAQVEISSLEQDSTNPLRISGSSNVDAAWHSVLIDSSDCDEDTSFPSDAGAINGQNYTYTILDTEQQRALHNGKHLCVRAAAAEGDSVAYRSTNIELSTEDEDEDEDETDDDETEDEETEDEDEDETDDDETEDEETEDEEDEMIDEDETNDEEVDEEDGDAQGSVGGIGGVSRQSEEPDQTEVLSDTGAFDDASNTSRLIGYVLIAAAVLGVARIVIVKKYSQVK